jgi:Na+-driven multidrug efflux pump
MYPWLLTGGTFLMWVYGVKGLAIGVSIGYSISLIIALFIWNRKRTSLTMAITPEIEMNVTGTVKNFIEMP